VAPAGVGFRPMKGSYDAIIIGAGVIGAAIGLELARKSYRTLNIDRHPAAGYGSTSSSCAIIRTFYSTVEGSLLRLRAIITGSTGPIISGSKMNGGLPGFMKPDAWCSRPTQTVILKRC
jgi:hypothetical protein